VRGGAVDAGLATLLGGVVGGGFGVGGRNEELISPIPMKKSSVVQLPHHCKELVAYMAPLSVNWGNHPRHPACRLSPLPYFDR